MLVSKKSRRRFLVFKYSPKESFVPATSSGLLPTCWLIAGITFLTVPANAQWRLEDRPARSNAPVAADAERARYKNAVADPVADTFGADSPQLDLTQLAAQVVGSDFVVSLTFDGRIAAPDSGAANALDGFIDLDLDQDGGTGDVPWTDLQRIDGGSTGMGNEAYVDLRSFDSLGNVELVNDASEQVIGRVPLLLGERTARILIPLDLLAGDRSIDVAAVIGTPAEATDIAPNQGSVASSDGTSAVLLQDNRFRVVVEWKDFEGNEGIGRVVEQSNDAAVFYFFAPSNWELLVKVLDGCSVNQRIWTFLSGSTNVEYTVTVTDVLTGQQQSYRNPLGRLAETVGDTEAFAVCP